VLQFNVFHDLDSADYRILIAVGVDQHDARWGIADGGFSRAGTRGSQRLANVSQQEWHQFFARGVFQTKIRIIHIGDIVQADFIRAISYG
jgi:hypothetical protein